MEPSSLNIWHEIAKNLHFYLNFMRKRLKKKFETNGTIESELDAGHSLIILDNCLDLNMPIVYSSKEERMKKMIESSKKIERTYDVS